MKAIILILIMSIAFKAQSQNFAEWFQQKKTQKKYLLLQIAALQVYKGYVRNGNSIVKNGLNTIGYNTGGEYNEHANYMNSLKRVNPNVKQNPKVKGTKEMHVEIGKETKVTYAQLQQTKVFSIEELQYVERVYRRLLSDCEAIINNLDNVTTNGNLEMKDDERVAQIELLHKDMQENYIFCQNFGSTAKKLALSRMKEQKEVETSRVLHGVKK